MPKLIRNPSCSNQNPARINRPPVATCVKSCTSLHTREPAPSPCRRPSAHRCPRCSFDFFDIVELPGLVEVCLLRTIEAKVREPPLARNSLDPILRLRRLDRAEIKVHRAVRVRGEVLPRRQVSRALVGDHWPARDVVVERERPELHYRRVGRHAQAVDLTTVEPAALFVLGRLQVDLAEVQDAALHAGGVTDRLVVPRTTLVDLGIEIIVLAELDYVGILPLLAG